MKPKQFLWNMAMAVIMISCKKEHQIPVASPPPLITKKILLKDIIIPHLPSPYYHFEYGPDSLVNKVDFASGFGIYEVLYNGGKVGEMRNNIFVNHDTLRYIYDNAGKVAVVKFINDHNELYRHAVFTYNGDKVATIEWDRKIGIGDFLIDRVLTFSYFPDGNLKEMHQHRSMPGVPDNDYTTHFDRYDSQINVDDNTVIHDGIHDHYLVLPNLHLQRNNPGKEWSTGDGSLYTVDYTYTYNTDGTPSAKSGDFVWTTGSQAGQHFATNTFYSYY